MPSNKKTTQQLLTAAKDGDDSAINLLMERHRNEVKNLVRMRLDQRIRQRIDVSDVVQDVLLEAYRRLQTYLAAPQIPFDIWLRQIALDRMIDSYRRHRSSARRSMDREIAATVASDTSNNDLQTRILNGIKIRNLTPAAMAIQKEIALEVEVAISKLSGTDSEIIIMRHYENLSNQEIARVLGLTEATASVRYVRALRRLRTILHQDSLDGPENTAKPWSFSS